MLIKAFENGVEINTTNSCDRLYFFEQHTKGHAKDLVRSFQHINPEPGYIRAKALLKEHFRDEQKVTSAYMDKALSWPPIKAEDVKSCWNTASSSEAAVIPWRMCSIFWICICLPTCWASLKNCPANLERDGEAMPVSCRNNIIGELSSQILLTSLKGKWRFWWILFLAIYKTLNQ